jgi:thiol-disulfide isomerase/thioredoxin
MRLITILCLLAASVHGQIVRDVRDALNRKDWTAAEAIIQSYRDRNGVTPEMLEAFSWLGRAALADKRYDDALRNAAETKRMVLDQLKTKSLDKDPNLPIALGAAIEVHAHALAARGERDQAVDYLRQELATYRASRIVATRTQKNLHLLSLEGKPAPAIEGVDLAKYKGKPVLLFLWAHWCGDCKQQGPILARLRDEFASKGLAIIAPTQLYGYAERGREVGPAEERRHIDKVRTGFYADLDDLPMPVNSANFVNLGVSTTPTLVLVNGRGTVTMYHPGKMTYEELAPKVAEAVGTNTRSRT